jgi:hypothetical protein
MSWRRGHCRGNVDKNPVLDKNALAAGVAFRDRYQHPNRRHTDGAASRCEPRESELELNLPQEMMLVHPVIHGLAKVRIDHHGPKCQHGDQETDYQRIG